MSAAPHDHGEHAHRHGHDHVHERSRPAAGPALSPSLLRLGLAKRAAIAGGLVALAWIMIAGVLS